MARASWRQTHGRGAERRGRRARACAEEDGHGKFQLALETATRRLCKVTPSAYQRRPICHRVLAST